MNNKEHFGMRLTRAEHSFLENLAVRNGATKTDALRKLIAAAMNGSKDDERLEQLINHIAIFRGQVQNVREEARYTGLLLTALVKRLAKDPGEGEKMIQDAVNAAKGKGGVE